MASGADHYVLAEELIGCAKSDGGSMTPEGRADIIALAQVHATLANAAANALSAYGVMPLADYRAWRAVCSEPEEAAMAAGEDGAP